MPLHGLAERVACHHRRPPSMSGKTKAGLVILVVTYSTAALLPRPASVRHAHPDLELTPAIVRPIRDDVHEPVIVIAVDVLDQGLVQDVGIAKVQHNGRDIAAPDRVSVCRLLHPHPRFPTL